MAKKQREPENDNVVEFPGGLDAAQFRVPGTDQKGHTARKYFNLTPALAQLIEILSTNGRFPYRNAGDFIRHAIVRHAHWLEKIGDLPSVTSSVEALNSLLRDTEFRMEFMDYIQRLAKTVEQLVDEGDEGAARKLVLDSIREVEKMPEGYWRDKYLRAIRDKNKRLLEDMPKANLAALGG